MAVQMFSPRSIAFLGNHLPRKCGIATFTGDLRNAVHTELAGQRDTFVIAMTNRPEGYDYPSCVRFEITQNTIRTYEQAADFINNSKVDVLCVQHEYGIYGGEWGNFLLRLMRKVKVPIVTTLHTVLGEDRGQKKVLESIFEYSNRVIVLSNRAIDLLQKEGMHTAGKVVMIPHGIPDLPFVDSNYYKDKFNVMGRTVILTFGLLSPGKGIEYMIDAMPGIIKNHPNVIYIVLGVTHPEILRNNGEEYRLKLIRQVEALGLEKHVEFHNRFVEIEELCEYLCSCDIYVMPYLNKQQIVSGTLAYAVGAGKAVISTPSWCAEEMLTDGRGCLVEFKDAKGFTDRINYLMDNQIDLHATRKQAYLHGRSMIWREVARQYLSVFDQVQAELPIVSTAAMKQKVHISATEFPEPNLEQMKVLTDDFAMFQHANFTVPNYKHGYCVDDNARALVVATKHYRLYEDVDSLSLMRRYFAFVLHAQNNDGTFRNFYSIQRTAMDEHGSDDTQGRCLWGLGYIISYAPDFFWMIAKSAFERAVTNTERLNLRGSSMAIMGMYYYLKRYPGDLNIRGRMRAVTKRVIDAYNAHASDKWRWFEEKITYANALMPTALWLAHLIFEEEETRTVADASSKFLMKVSTMNHRVSLVGCNGWMSIEDSRKADFDQQPIDAMWMVQMAKAGYVATNDEAYLRFMRQAFDWFLGVNDIGVRMYDYFTGGCYDGLTPTGPNLNQGAESTLSYLLALLDIMEMSQK